MSNRSVNKPTYYAPAGGHPPQTQLLSDRAVFTEAYAIIPRGVMRDIVASALPHWEKTRLWVLSRPLSGFAETFSQYIMEVSPGGGSSRPELDACAEGVLFVVEGEMTLTIAGQQHRMQEGGYAFIPPGASWQLFNESDVTVRFHWVRKAYEHVDGIAQVQRVAVRLTPALWSIILLHHQWDHVQLLLMGVVLRRDQTIETDTMPIQTHFNRRALLRGGRHSQPPFCNWQTPCTRGSPHTASRQL